MRIFIWILQVALAGLFLMAGFAKGFQPVEALHANISWARDIPLWVPRLAGFSEILGAIGVILPAVTRIKPGLVPLAAGGLALVMALAIVFHLTRGEFGLLVGPLALFALAAFVGFARLKLAPIAPRYAEANIPS